MDLHTLIQTAQVLATIKGAEEAQTIIQTLPTTKTHRPRQWFEDHADMEVNTIQIKMGWESDEVRGVWIPGPRTVQANNPKGAVISGSAVHYKGVKVLAADSTTIVLWNPEWRQFTIYTTR